MIDESKMYVVVGVLLIILLGLFFYLLMIDLKLRKLEKKVKGTVKPGNESTTAELNQKQ